MKTIKIATAVLAAVSLVVAPVFADWDEGDPFKMHYPQLPDLSTQGLDVLAGPISLDPSGTQAYEKFLADDWQCTFSGPVTDIHIWGSFNEDLPFPPLATAAPSFSLVIYDNIPAEPGASFSRPGKPLWDTYIQPSAVRPYATAQEGFFDPNLNEIIGFDSQVWQFNFLIPEAEAFRQTKGDIYWLGVHHTFDLNGDGIVDLSDQMLLAEGWPAAFGWKTSGVPQFEDDAVWADVFTFGTDPHVVPVNPMWNELIDPRTGQSLDLAFVITGIPEPASIVLLILGAVGVAGSRRRGC